MQQTTSRRTPVETAEIIAQQLQDVSRGIKKLREGRLNERALVALLHDSTRMAKSDIERILDGLENLEKTYLKKPQASAARPS